MTTWRGEVAEEAVYRDRAAGRPVGKQDQYVAAFGGLKTYHFEPDGQVVGVAAAYPRTRSTTWKITC